MALKLYVGLDLGSDTLKIAYALNVRGAEHTGKITGDKTAMTAVPAVAYYDFDEERWLLGYEVDSVGDKSFVSVVKIKTLLSLLLKDADAGICSRNRDYYFNRTRFPKFYFPVRRRRKRDFAEADSLGMTFGGGITPAELCQKYFAYIKRLVDAGAEKLCARYKESSVEIIPSVVYPQFVGSEYTDELTSLVKSAFGRAPEKSLSLTKALCAYASETGRLASGEFSLIFNLGEDSISVIKANLSPSGVSVDGADGHSDPIGLGGNDIDDAVSAYLETALSERETMGRPSSGEDGHIVEAPLNTKQYLFLADIKAAKIIFGMSGGVFSDGVPVCLSRDLFIQRTLTKGEFLACTGIADGTGVARRIADYIEEEVSRPINSNVKKVFLTGGCVETCGLLDYIKSRIEKNGVSVLTFENAYSVGVGEDEFGIYSYEDALYAPSLGCALAALKGIEIKTTLALSYGLRLYMNNRPFLELLVNKGAEIPQSGKCFYTPTDKDKVGISTLENSEHSAAMRIMSTFITQQDIDIARYSPGVEYFKGSNGQNYLLTATESRASMNKLAKLIGLRQLTAVGGNGAGFIYYFYNGARVSVDKSVNIVIGVNIDGEGRAKPYAKNDEFRNGNKMVTVRYLGNLTVKGKVVRRRGECERVFAKDIVFDFDLGYVDFM